MRETLDAVGRDLLDKARPGLLAALSTPATADNGLGGLRNMAVLELFGSMNHPGASSLLIECFDRQPSEMALAMLSQRRGDADVRRKLEQVATDFPQENLRKLAGMLLAVPSP
jgi:hypothetical protein